MRIDIDAVTWEASGHAIIHDITTTIEPGVLTALIGPNGSGKSTLLHVLAGLKTPAKGHVLIDGDDVHAMTSRDRARRIALLEQQSATTLDLTVRQVVELGRIPHRGRWPGAVNEGAAEVDRALQLTRIEDLATRSWLTLSGGERQRVQLARSLAQEPSVLLLDEPTNHLDLGHQIDFLTTVRGLGVTTVAALHDLDLAAAFCDHLVVLAGGTVVASGLVDSVLTPALVEEVYGVRTVIGYNETAARRHVMWRR